MRAGDREAAPLGSLILVFPALMLAAFFLVPFAILVAMSFYHRTESFYEPGFELTNYARVFAPLYLQSLYQSVEFSFLATTAALAIAFPFTFILSRYPRRVQVFALVFVLCVLSLSEVIVAFSWSQLLSRPAGISNLLAYLGLMEKPASWSRGYWSVLLCLTYFNLPFAILVLYPHCTRLEREITEAAQTMGASPVRAFFTVVVPILQPALITAWIILFVFTMGALVTPQWLGRPEHWMFAIYIGSEVLERGNVPFGAALAMFYLVVTLILVSVTVWIGRRQRRLR